MLSRGCVFAAVTLLVSCLADHAAWAQATNLEAGKSASQLFAGTCTACHKGPRGLLKTVSPGSLPGFLREHYTTSSDMASQLATFLISNGASDTRQAKQGGANDQGDRQTRRQRNPAAQEAARPDGENAVPGDSGRQGHRRLVRPEGEETKPSDGPAQGAIDRGPDGRRQRPGRRIKPGPEESPTAREELPKADPGLSDEAKGEITGKTETTTVERTRPDDDHRSNEVRPNEAKPVEIKPSEARSSDVKPNDRSDGARTEPAKDVGGGEKSVMRHDPAPPSPAATPVIVSTSPKLPAPKAPAPAAEPPVATSASPAGGPPVPPISR